MEITTLRVDWISDLDTDHFANFAFPFLFISSKITVHFRRYIKHDHSVFHPADIQTSTVELSHPLQKFAGWTIDS